MSGSSANQRRQARLRREYLHRKSLESTEAAKHLQKKKLREALLATNSSTGKKSVLPTELLKDYDSLNAEINTEDARTAVAKNHVDDEYGDAGLLDPRVCVTTSRDPSSRLKQFAKEMNLMVPNATRVNRGNYRLDELLESCKESEVSDIVMVQETRGEPDGLVICHLPLGPTAYFTLSNTVLRHDIENGTSMSEAYPHIILNGFSSQLGQRLGNVLKCLFPVPKADTKRIITLQNDNDFISFRHHMYNKIKEDKVELSEVGPRFEMQLYQLKLGTMDNKEAEMEYVLRPYMNTSKKRKVL
jgi:U3 small nucleolar ribonucleoprotein protein IMP4